MEKTKKTSPKRWLIIGLILLVGIALIFYKAKTEKRILERGVEYGKQGNYDAAITEFNQVISTNPNFAYAYYNRGIAYLNKGNYDQAFLDFNKAIKIKPNFTEAYANRARTYLQKQDYDKMWEDLHKAEALGYKINSKILEDIKKISGREE